MRNLGHCRANADPDRGRGRRALLAFGVTALLASCAQPSKPPQVAAPTPPAPPPVHPVPFPQAVLNAANGVFSTAPTGGQRRLVVIDPLVNGVTGERTAATQQIQDQIIALAREKYPQFDIQPFTGGLSFLSRYGRSNRRQDRRQVGCPRADGRCRFDADRLLP